MRTTIKIVVNGIGIYLASLAARPVLEFQGSGLQLLLTVVLVGLVFGLFNTYAVASGLKWPLALALVFAGNVLLLRLVAEGTEHLASRLYFENFWPVLAGGVIATTVAFVLRALLPQRSLREAMV
ncbi:hypothetical protein [Kribbella sp. NPDC000426]|uniref:hypothetical protein n=1 Tax=Kribbella sp. NPDC000426 TaxID=3154255 RepID=UPI00332C6FBF